MRLFNTLCTRRGSSRQIPWAIVLILALAAGILVSSAQAETLGVAPDGIGWLEGFPGGYRVLHLKGDHYQMGLQHGYLMATEIQEHIQAYVYDYAIFDHGMTLAQIMDIWNSAEPFIPQRFKDELQGVADASGVDLGELQAMNILPMRYHCSGIAVWGRCTRLLGNGPVHQTRSLDYDLEIGHTVHPQDNALIILREPESYIASVSPLWSGFIGTVGGMNAEGIAVSEMGSGCSDESYHGLPMTVRLIRVLEEAKNLNEAVSIMTESNGTCGFNFLVTSGFEQDGRAIELTHTLSSVSAPEDPVEDNGPHWPIEDALRRTNHFLDYTTAATQRDEYGSLVNPKDGDYFSWVNYYVQSTWIDSVAWFGGMNAYRCEMMMRRIYSLGDDIAKLVGESLPVMYQAVFSPGLGKFRVAYAHGQVPAQRFPYFEYDLNQLLAAQP